MEQNKITPMQAPPQVIVIDCVKPESRKLRVAACVRVSSDSDEQENSFANQISHYTSLISQHSEWEFVGIYADNAKSGLKADNREEFQRMLTDCRMRKIDRILTKSVSRFSRNIKDTLTTVRELKNLGVSVYFEKEGIDTNMLSSELLLTTFATLAQEESLNISRNLKIGYRARMRQGTAVQSNVPYGYRLVDKEMVICPEEAEVVRRIFDDYLAGVGMIEIANRLTERAEHYGNIRIWDHRSIGYILHNERYIGDALWQKRYTTDTLPLTVKRNNGEKAMYYVNNNHEPIISCEIFEATKQRLNKSNTYRCKNSNVRTYPLSKILLCSDCRTTFRRKISSSQVYWGCEKRDKQKSWCRTSIVPELSIYKTFCCLYNCIHHNKLTHIELLLHSLEKLRQVRDKDNHQIQAIDQQIQELLEQHQMLSSLRAKGVLDAALCIAQQHELNQKLERLRQEKKAARTYDETDDAILRTQELLDLLETGPAYMDTFDEQIFKAMVRKIVVYPEDKLVFHLHNGLELEERLERTVRR